MIRKTWLSTCILPVTLSVAWLSYAGDNGPVIPPAAHGEQCVADTDIMRTNHMVLLNHQRDETVIDGVRGGPFSLIGCVNCHAGKDEQGKPVRIDARGQFCESCHSYAAVEIDCFSCHAALPEEVAAADGKSIGIAPGALPVASNYSKKQLLVLQSHKVAHNAQHDARPN